MLPLTENGIAMEILTLFISSPPSLFQVSFFKKAIEDMAAGSLRCVAIAFRSYELKDVPPDEEQLSKWILPENELILLAIVGIKVCVKRENCQPDNSVLLQ